MFSILGLGVEGSGFRVLGARGSRVWDRGGYLGFCIQMVSSDE